MNLKSVKKLIMILLVISLLICLFPKFTYAAGASTGISFSSADEFVKKGKFQAQSEGLSSTDLKNIGEQFVTIAKILIYIGAGILVVSTAYMGIKYMMASPEQQGKLKQQLIGLLVSAIVIFGAYFIWSTIYNLLSTSFGA